MAITLQEVGTDGIDGTDTGHPRPPITLILHKIQSCRNLQISSVTENHLLPPPTVRCRLHRGSSGLFLLISTSRCFPHNSADNLTPFSLTLSGQSGSYLWLPLPNCQVGEFHKLVFDYAVRLSALHSLVAAGAPLIRSTSLPALWLTEQ